MRNKRLRERNEQIAAETFEWWEAYSKQETTDCVAALTKALPSLARVNPAFRRTKLLDRLARDVRDTATLSYSIQALREMGKAAATEEVIAVLVAALQRTS